MVSFVCYYCDTTLKKKQLLNHSYQCRKPNRFICIDCHKTFEGDEHIAHIKCMTEEEKYWGQYAQKKKQNGNQKPLQNNNQIKEEENKQNTDKQIQKQEQIVEVNKEKQDENVNLEQKEVEQENNWIGWRKFLKGLLKDNLIKEMKLSKIKKIALQQYLEIFPEQQELEKEILSIIDQKIRKQKGIQIFTEEFVKLL